MHEFEFVILWECYIEKQFGSNSIMCWILNALNKKVGVKEIKVTVEPTSGFVVLAKSFENGEQSLSLCFKWEFIHLNCYTGIFLFVNVFSFFSSNIFPHFIFFKQFFFISYQMCSLPTLFMFQWNPKDKLHRGNQNLGSDRALHFLGKGWIFFRLKLCCFLVTKVTKLTLNKCGFSEFWSLQSYCIKVLKLFILL